MGRLVSLLWHRLEIEKARVKRGPVQGGKWIRWEVTHMTDEQTIEQLLEPSAVLSRALDFMETDLDADAYNVISAWVARAIREVSEDLARVSTPERLE